MDCPLRRLASSQHVERNFQDAVRGNNYRFFLSTVRSKSPGCRPFPSRLGLVGASVGISVSIAVGSLDGLVSGTTVGAKVDKGGVGESVEDGDGAEDVVGDSVGLDDGCPVGGRVGDDVSG